MRRLCDYQIVGLSAAASALECRVVATGGGEAVLEPRDLRDLGQTVLPSRATLGFETDRHPVMLSGMAAVGPLLGTLRFVVTEPVGLRELRLRPRLSGSFATDLTPLDPAGLPAGPAVRRTTVDISAGGIGVVGFVAPQGSFVAVSVAVPTLPQPVACAARVLRRRDRGCSLAFVDLDEGLAVILERTIFSVRRGIARQAFAGSSEEPRTPAAVPAPRPAPPRAA